MKKIYIFTAVLALLTLSLNAQLKATKNGMAVQPMTSTEKVEVKEVTKPDGYFRMGPSRASSDPVTPPYSNGFSNSTEWDWWEVIDVNGYTTWTRNSNGYAQYQYSSSNPGNDWLITAPVTLQAGKIYTFSIDAWVRGSSYPEKLEVKLASANTAAALSAGTTIIGSTTLTNTSATTLSNENIRVSTSGNYYIGIHAISEPDMYYLYVDNLVIDMGPDPVHDLGIALSAPTTAGAGNTVDVTATVTNNGDFAENGYTVTVSDGTNIVNITAQEALGIGETTTFTVQFATSANAGGSTVNYTATVACTDDAVADNNTATASTSLINLPPPENVAATANGNNGTMTWDAPSNLPIIQTTVPETVTENFDDTSVFPSFSIGGITATQHTGTIGDWTVYTPSSDYVYGPQNVTFENDNEPQAWTVFNPSIAGTSWTPHSGSQFMISFCDAGDENGDNIQTTNHWLISPELSGNAQTITFWERVITTQYGDETYEVLASSTDNNPASFSLVKSFTSNTTSWTQRTASLPAGTKYFAIRHTAYDIFGVMIDDVTYEISNVVETQLAPESYNIYLDGEFVGNVNANTFSYDFSDVSVGEHTCAVSAVYSYGESVAVPATFTTQPKTEAPVISYETVGDNVVITATGNGTVTLNIPGYPAATGTGSASITVPRHMEDYTVTATATAQEADHLVSEATTEQVPIPGIASEQGWLQMDGSYTTGDQQLSFTRGNNPILFVDQFTAETHKNEHPDHYDYCLSEDVENDAKTSSTIPIPVHKTYSTLQGLYTKAEVDNDALNTPREITANAVNGTMAYDIKAGSEVYFYGLYRGALDANPVIDDSHRISMIQKDLNEAFFNENMTNDVEPKYSHIGAGDIKRVDKDFVTGNNSNTMAYVPVIWTYGDHTGRPAATGNNSYGSDIKRMKIGDVTARIEGTKSDGNSWGKWKVGETEYCVYTPVISITGIMPVDIPQGDGDYATYEPYMFRAWCTYDKAYDFGHDADGHLVGGDLIPAPFLLDSVLLEPNQKEYVLGGDWNGETRMPWAFGVEVGESATNITFLIRFYYKKVVTDAQQSSKLMGNRDGEDAEEYFAVQCEGDAQGIVTAINEILNGRIPIETTYVNAQGMTSNKPFDGLNIVVTRYSDGSTTTTKVVR